MGLLATDVTPFQPTGPTVLIPTAKDTYVKVFQVARTDTGSVLKAVLAADATITRLDFYGGTASDAGTSATVSLTVANNSGTLSTGSVDVKANGATTARIQMSNLPNLEPRPLLGDITIKATYAETGTASTTGGPWFILVEFIR